MEPEFKKDDETQVLIAGAGPVGLALALELGWHGIRCLLVEQKEEFTGNPKAKTVHQRILELFRRWVRSQRSCEQRLRWERISPRIFFTLRV